MLRTTVVVVVILSSITGVLGQATQPSIVSSVKRSQKIDEGIGGANFLRGDTFRMTNVPLIVVLGAAYGAPGMRVVGGPDWIQQDRWDIEIKVELAEGAVRARTPDVVQATLRDRFKLDAVVEKRDHPLQTAS